MPATPFLDPSLIRKCLTSGWKITINASTPTSIKVPSRAFISLMLKAATTTRNTNSRMMAMNMLMAADPLIQRKTRKIRMATIRMSRQSANDRFRKPNIDNGATVIPFFYQCCKDSDFSLIIRD